MLMLMVGRDDDADNGSDIDIDDDADVDDYCDSLKTVSGATSPI